MEHGWNFDAGKFISEIESRPPLWDTTLEAYSNRELKKQLWDEMVDLFEGAELKEDERTILGINLQKKWKNIRDCYGRELRRLKDIKSGTASTRKNSYVYFKQLSFLKKCTPTETLEEISSKNIVPPRTVKVRLFQKTSRINSKKRKREETSDVTSIENKEKTDEFDDDKLFLMSLLPDLKKVPDSVKLSTKMELMSVIQKAQKPENEGVAIDDNDEITSLFRIKSDIDIQESRIQRFIDYNTLTHEVDSFDLLLQENKTLKEEVKKITLLQEQQSEELLLCKQNEAKLTQMVQAVRQIVTEDISNSDLHIKEET